MADGRGSRWGWVLVVVAAILVLLSAIYPLVEEPENRLAAVLVIGACVVAVVMAVGPMRRGERTRAMWLLPIGLVLGTPLMAAIADTAFTVVTLVLAAATGLGLWLTRPTSR